MPVSPPQMGKQSMSKHQELILRIKNTINLAYTKYLIPLERLVDKPISMGFSWFYLFVGGYLSVNLRLKRENNYVVWQESWCCDS
jgi:hypothetical protein